MKDMKMICEETMKHSYAEKVAVARSMINVLASQLPGPDGLVTIISICFLASGLDGKIAPNEVKMINEITGFKYTIDSLTKQVNDVKSITEQTFKMISSWPEGIKNAFMMLIVCVCTADGDLDKKEYQALEKYFA